MKAIIQWCLGSYDSFCFSMNLNFVQPRAMSNTLRIAVAFTLLLCLVRTGHAAESMVLPSSLQIPMSSDKTGKRNLASFSLGPVEQARILDGLITTAATTLQNPTPPVGTGVLAPQQPPAAPLPATPLPATPLPAATLPTPQQTPPLLRSPNNELPEPKVQAITPPRTLNPAAPAIAPEDPSIGEPVKEIPIEEIPATTSPNAEPVPEIIHAPSVSGSAYKDTIPRHRRFLRACGTFCKPLHPINLFDSGLIFATESTFLSASTLGTTRVSTTDLLTDTTDSRELESGFGFGQRVMLGLQSQVFGLEVIYWNFADEGFDSSAWKNNSHTPQFGLGRRLDIETLDLGITQRFCLGRCRIKTALGLRMLEFGASEQAHAMRTYHQNIMEVSSAAILKRTVDAIGPTLGIRGRHPAWPSGCECGTTCTPDCYVLNRGFSCNLYWDTRISWLWADQSTSAMTEAVAATSTQGNPAVARAQDAAITTTDESDLQMHFGLQTGVEFCKRIGCRSMCILRCGFEYQYFEIGRDYTASTSTAFLTDGTNFGAQTTALAENSNTDVHMFGISFLAGVNF